jgi:alkyl hydroperoxide reductase subunit AhpC
VAKELTITINVETGQATTNLRQVDAAMDKVAQHAGGPLNDSLKKLDGTTQELGGSVKNFAIGMVAGLASMEAISRATRALVGFVKDSVAEYAAAEAAQVRLRSALENSRQPVEAVSQAFESYAKHMAATTTLEDDAVISTMALATEMGVTAGQMSTVIDASANLASAWGVSLDSAMSTIVKGGEGMLRMFRSHGVELDKARVDAEGLDYVLGILQERFKDNAQNELNTYTGQVKALANAWLDLKEAVGGLLVGGGALNGLLAETANIVRGLTAALNDTTILRLVLLSQVLGRDVGDTLRMIGAGQKAAAAAHPQATGDIILTDPVVRLKATQAASDATARAMVAAAARAEQAWQRVVETLYSQEHQYDVDKLFRDMFANSKTWDEVAKELPPYIVTAIQKSVAEAQRQLDTMKPFDIMTILTGNAGNETLIGSTFAQRFKAVGAAIADVFRNINTTAGQIAQVATGTMNVWFDKTVTGAEKTAQKMVAVFAAAAQIISMLFGGSKGGQIASTAFGGAAAGAGIGFLFGGVLGAGIGAAIGGIAGLIGGIGAAAKTTRDANIAATAQIKELQKQLLTTYGSLAEVDKMSQQLGVDLVGAWGDKSQAGLAHFNALLDVFNAKLALAPTWDKATALMEKYGISIERAGQAIRQLMITDSARTLINDWQQWKSLIGDDTAAMEEFAKASASQFSMLVQQSAAYGTAIPENMKPMLEFLVKSGLLLDANGKAITDIAGITFGKAVQTEQEKLVASLDRLTAALIALTPQWGGGGGAGGGIDRVIGEQNARMLPPSFAGGTRGQYRDFGRGTLAVLHGRERVMTEGEGSGGSAPTIVIQALDSADVETWLRRGGAQKIAAAMVPVFPGAAKFRVGRR